MVTTFIQTVGGIEVQLPEKKYNILLTTDLASGEAGQQTTGNRSPASGEAGQPQENRTEGNLTFLH